MNESLVLCDSGIRGNISKKGYKCKWTWQTIKLYTQKPIKGKGTWQTIKPYTQKPIKGKGTAPVLSFDAC